MPRLLVISFSRSGTTRKVAEEIAGRLQADREDIRESRSRLGFLGYVRSAREALGRRVIEIDATRHNPADYDLLVIGSPVWASNLSSPVRAYLTRHARQFRRVALFCTQGGSGAPAVLKDMSALCGQAPVATLILKQSEVRAGTHKLPLQQFVTSVKASVGS